MAGYLGAIPVPQATQNRESFTCSANQTSFATAGYTQNFVDCFLNGVRLNTADFTATNGSDIVLAAGAAVNDILDVISYATFEVNAQTFTGTTTLTDVVASSLDISGAVDIAGTTNLDVVDIDGTVNIAAATTIATNNKIQFRDTAIHISSPADGDLAIAADDEIDITSTLIDINGNLDVSGTALVTGVLTTTAATVFNGGFQSNELGFIIVADGDADNQYVAKIHNLESTDDRSWGLEIQAGSTAADLPLSIETHDSGTNLLQVAGSGQVRFVDGTVSLPAISNLGDLNTGIFFPAADTLGFSTGGAERLRITSAGFVGISTTAPAAPLQVDTDNDFPAVVLSRDGGVSGRRPFGIGVGGAADATLFITASNDTTGAGAFGGSRVVLMELEAAGDVTVKSGNLKIGTAGKGIDFSAQTATSASGASATSELFDHYEEGTWTPSIANATVTGTLTVNGRYTRIGRQVTLQCSLSAATSIAHSASCLIQGFPFAGVTYVNEGISRVAGVIAGGGNGDLPSTNHSATCFVDPPNSRAFLGNFTTTGANENIYMTATYFVA